MNGASTGVIFFEKSSMSMQPAGKKPCLMDRLITKIVVNGRSTARVKGIYYRLLRQV
jgi:hypothetical protein